MAFQTYEELNAEVMSRYQAQDFQGMLDLLDREGGNFPEEAYQTHYLKACMTARLEQPEKAIALIQEAMDRGDWYGEDIMRNSPSFAPLQGRPEFERLVVLAQRKQEEAQGQGTMLTLEPEGGCAGEQGCALVLTLHGNGENAAISLNAWRSVAAVGRLLVSLQSGQPISSRQSVWTGVDASMQTVEELYAQILDKYNIDSSKTILGGFSMGGEIALRTAMQGTIPSQGFILLAPSMPAMDQLKGLLAARERSDRRDLRGYIILGGDDVTIPAEDVSASVDRLNEAGIPTHLVTIPGIAHRYPPEFDRVIAEAIAFIEQPR